MNEGTLAHVDQKLIHRIPKAHLAHNYKWVEATETRKPSQPLVEPSAIKECCVGFPDLDSENWKHEFYFLAPVKNWGGLFEGMALEQN